jgi:hypothetical protein
VHGFQFSWGGEERPAWIKDNLARFCFRIEKFDNLRGDIFQDLEKIQDYFLIKTS